ncbi:hypothetical protein [Helicobacter sp.]|uniref:hypothetical protein n=1 Tax=Helicobacter sp. TaxID=218 RepID=UPI0025B7CD0C|nr:hypothetical protein [Helicobacter sp.]MCI5969211.1 hypothetical protein [Helicobacter sp.]MDY2584939.1 hypothetical protein [Helicobacter sp.]
MLSRNEIIAQLMQYGYAKDTLDKMQTIELEHLFKQHSKERITGYLEILKQNEVVEIAVEDDTDYIEEEIGKIYYAISGEEVNFVSLYDAIEKVFDHYDLNETIELVLSQSSDKRCRQMTQIVEIAYRAYQEALLAEIERFCEFYPPQERFEQMQFYSSKRADIAFLRQSIQTMRLQNNQESLSRIAQQKFAIIHDYYPDIMYESYEEYYENDEEKDAIIGRIMALTRAYKRAQLKTKKFQILKHMERVLLEDKEREKEEKALIKQYVKRVGEAIAQEDELMFGETIKEALKVLDERDVQYIVEHFDLSSNPLILQRFNIIMRDNRPK